uniref:Uncharacterized protein n=1 Tax=Panagrolaimus superbus TaxID=310955 RepID=A0A914YL48_9BILA
MFIGRRVLFPGKSGYVATHSVQPLSLHLLHRNSLASIATLASANNLHESNGNSFQPPSESYNNDVTHQISKFGEATSQQPSSSTTKTNGSAKILTSKRITNQSSQIWDIKSYPWYFGVKERMEANQMLCGTSDGTFIVRLSQRENKYVISITFNGGYKHMKIESGEDPVLGKIYWLSDNSHFTSVPELIEYYHEHCLTECFENINTKLSKTLLKTRLYKVKVDYFRNSETNRYLTLEREDVVEVVDTNGEENGWWRFKNGDQIGFFPMAFVEPIEDEDDNNDETTEDISNAENNDLGLTAC